MTVDLKPLVDLLFNAIWVVLPVVVPWIAMHAIALLKANRLTAKLVADEKSAQAIERVLGSAAQLGVAWAQRHGGNLQTVQVQNRVAAEVARYVAEKAPQAVQRLGVTDDTLRAMAARALGVAPPEPAAQYTYGVPVPQTMQGAFAAPLILPPQNQGA